MEPIVNVPIGDYDALRNRVKELEEENKCLREERDKICDENKVRVIEREFEVLYHGGLCLKTLVKDKLLNFDDVKEDVEKKFTQYFCDVQHLRGIKDLEKVELERQKLEKEVFRLKNRSLWKRILNI